MSDRSKIIISVLILLAVILALYFFNLGSFGREICPPSQCKIYATDANGNSIGMSSPEEAGRLHKDFIGIPPTGLPSGIPVDPKPLKILTSYVESVEANESSNEPFHSQVTYSYITSENATKVFENFKKYFIGRGYSVSLEKVIPNDPTYRLFGQRNSGETYTIATLSVVAQNQFESIIHVSLVTSEIIKNQ